jgi:hypothetical protein
MTISFCWLKTAALDPEIPEISVCLNARRIIWGGLMRAMEGEECGGEETRLKSDGKKETTNEDQNQEKTERPNCLLFRSK